MIGVWVSIVCVLWSLLSGVLSFIKSSHINPYIHNNRGKGKGNVKKKTLRMNDFDVKLWRNVFNQFSETPARNSWHLTWRMIVLIVSIKISLITSTYNTHSTQLLLAPNCGCNCCCSFESQQISGTTAPPPPQQHQQRQTTATKLVQCREERWVWRCERWLVGT